MQLGDLLLHAGDTLTPARIGLAASQGLAQLDVVRRPTVAVFATGDELDGSQLNVKCWINGELRQNANTRDLIFDIPTLIETISAGLTLRAGDVIATGTPAGVGIGFTPPRFLQRGDVMDIEIDGLGRWCARASNRRFGQLVANAQTLGCHAQELLPEGQAGGGDRHPARMRPLR